MGKSTQFRRGLYGPKWNKDSVIKGGMTIPNIATFDHGTYEEGAPFCCFGVYVGDETLSSYVVILRNHYKDLY